MKTETFSGTIENAYGKPLATAVKFEGSYEAFENHSELVAQNELPSNQEIVDFKNNQRKANARQKAMAEALKLAGIEKPTLENDADLRFATLVKTIVASGKSKEVAEQTARTILGM